MLQNIACIFYKSRQTCDTETQNDSYFGTEGVLVSGRRRVREGHQMDSIEQFFFLIQVLTQSWPCLLPKIFVK